jgi:protein SCO1/2
MKKLTQISLIVVIGAISLGVGAWLSKMQQTSVLPTDLNATVLDKPRTLTPFLLVDQHNKAFTQDSFKGQWSYLFFGYTNCPDVCPLALKVMQTAWETIPKEDNANHPVKMYLVSVDPDRDTPKLLNDYVTFFNPEFGGLTGNADQIDNFTNQLGILYGFQDKEKESDSYLVNHSAQFLLINPKGQLQAVISPPHDAAKIVAELPRIFNYYQSL